jgi:hypothetical protein
MDYRTYGPRVLGVLLFALSAGVSGQQIVFKGNCMTIGVSPPEQLTGAQGQSVSVGNYTCQMVGGPLDGGIVTGTSIWHYEKGVGKGMSGAGVTRRPDAQAVWDQSEATMNLHVAEGRVTGYSGTGKGQFKLATGAASALNGRLYKFNFRSTGPGSFEVETIVD